MLDKALQIPLKQLKKPFLTRHFTKRRAHKAGMPPGHVVHIGERKEERVKFSVIDYNKKRFSEKELEDVHECIKFKKSGTVTWINISGVHDVSAIQEIGNCFSLHPLLLEDVANTDQRPKLEDFEDYLFVVLRMLVYDDARNSINSEQVSMVIGKNFVLSFQETEGDVFDSVRNRIRTSKGRFRKSGPDYLAYALIDAIVDQYFVILERLGEKIEDLEEQLATDPRQKHMPILHTMKREMIFLRRAVWPLREVISGAQRGDSKLIKPSTKVYLRDVYDHTIQVIDTVETFRDMLSGMLDLYLSSVSNKMNEVMKVLTIFAAIFIPLTFIAGIYGMNFSNMPELEWQYGYFYTLALMGMIAVGLLAYFKKKKWF